MIDFQPEASDRRANVFRDLAAVVPETMIGFEDAHFVADLDKYQHWKHLCGSGSLRWRSGVKHDCSKVMELRREGQKYRNAFGELVDLEDTFLFPMLKSSDVANGAQNDFQRWMIVTQRNVGEETAGIADRAPKTWAYLNKHAGLLARRASSIYRGRPPFSIFGIGDYSFAPWKVAISGFYKRLSFQTVGEMNGKPTMLDDTSYFIPCQTADEAEFLVTLLNSPVAEAFFDAFIFWDAKRPITVDLLRRLDLRLLARELGNEEMFVTYFGDPVPSKRAKRRIVSTTLALWPD